MLFSLESVEYIFYWKLIPCSFPKRKENDSLHPELFKYHLETELLVLNLQITWHAHFEMIFDKLPWLVYSQFFFLFSFSLLIVLYLESKYHVIQHHLTVIFWMTNECIWWAQASRLVTYALSYDQRAGPYKVPSNVKKICSPVNSFGLISKMRCKLYVLLIGQMLDRQIL